MSAKKKTRSKRKGGAKAAVVKTKAATTKPEASAKIAKTKKTDGEAKPACASLPACHAQAGTADRPKRLSALDAAAQVLATADKPMRAQDLIVAMAEQGLWTSPAGKTPHATLYAAILREINTTVNDVEGRKVSRFRKVDRGLFEFNEHSKR